MRIHMDEEKRIAEIWLTKAESDDPALILCPYRRTNEKSPCSEQRSPHNSPFPANNTTGNATQGVEKI